MQDSRLNKLKWISPFLIFVTATIFQELFSLIDDRNFEYLGTKIGYKGLVLTCLFLICGLASLWIHFTTQSKQTPAENLTNNNQPRNKSETKHDQILQNLSSDEKRLLRQYITKDVKVLKLFFGNGTAHGLVKQGILFTSPSYSLDINYNFNLSEWTWKKLKENPKLLE